MTVRQRVQKPLDPAPELVNLEAERAVLGKLLLDDRIWWDVADRLAAEDFSDPTHQSLYRAMRALMQSARPLKPQLILAQLGTAEDAQVGLAALLAGLTAYATRNEVVGVSISHFVDVVLHRSGCRALIAAADLVTELAKTAKLETPIEEVRADAQKLVAANDNERPSDDQKLSDLVSLVISEADAAKKSGRPIGLRTGLKAFDDLVGSILPEQVIVLGGETSAGKTALATQVGVMLAAQNIPVHLTSLEMGGGEIAMRVLAAYSEVSAEKMSDGRLEEADLERMMRLGERTVGLSFWISDRPRQTIGTIQARLARAQARHGVKLGIIDHLQYIRPDNPRAEEREQIRQVADDCKAMAKRLGMPILLLSHVVRTVDFASIKTAADIKRPVLRDLYGSSAIEKAADAIVFVHRPMWFLERATPPAKYKADMDADKLKWAGKAELVLPKRRAGKGYGIRTCTFDERLTWFRDEPQQREADIGF